jgi:hypothetical protein
MFAVFFSFFLPWDLLQRNGCDGHDLSGDGIKRTVQ